MPSPYPQVGRDVRGFFCAENPGAGFKQIEANRPPHEPLINIEHGDLPLLLFLLAGAAGGFAAGYSFRGLFPPKDKGERLATGI